MELIIDNEIAKLFVSNPVKTCGNPIFTAENRVSLRWPTLLEYLRLGSVLSHLPKFDQNQPLFQASVATLCGCEETEVVFYLYDKLFGENIHQINNLVQIKPPFLLQAIKECNHISVLASSLTSYETALRENPSHTMHDLILYLAWDQMCACMGALFDYPSTDPKFIQGLSILRGCLIESYQHITQQGRTRPGIYRMLESFLFYEMREENLKKHSDLEWKIFRQSIQFQRAKEELLDCFYIDEGMITREKIRAKEENPTWYLTLDSPAFIDAQIAFAQCMMDKLTAEMPHWNFELRPGKIVHL